MEQLPDDLLLMLWLDHLPCYVGIGRSVSARLRKVLPAPRQRFTSWAAIFGTGGDLDLLRAASTQLSRGKQFQLAVHYGDVERVRELAHFTLHLFPLREVIRLVELAARRYHLEILIVLRGRTLVTADPKLLASAMHRHGKRDIHPAIAKPGSSNYKTISEHLAIRYCDAYIPNSFGHSQNFFQSLIRHRQPARILRDIALYGGSIAPWVFAGYPAHVELFRSSDLSSIEFYRTIIEPFASDNARMVEWKQYYPSRSIEDIRLDMRPFMPLVIRWASAELFQVIYSGFKRTFFTPDFAQMLHTAARYFRVDLVRILLSTDVPQKTTIRLTRHHFGTECGWCHHFTRHFTTRSPELRCRAQETYKLVWPYLDDCPLRRPRQRALVYKALKRDDTTLLRALINEVDPRCASLPLGVAAGLSIFEFDSLEFLRTCYPHATACLDLLAPILHHE